MANGRASIMQVADEFRSFVKPTWAPILSPFCTSLTGITQVNISSIYQQTLTYHSWMQPQVDNAPTFPTVLQMFEKFLIKNGLIDAVTGERLVHFCWCTDGPFDVQNFVVKQCFISKVRLPLFLHKPPECNRLAQIAMPQWLRGDVIDVRKEVCIFR